MKHKGVESVSILMAEVSKTSGSFQPALRYVSLIIQKYNVVKVSFYVIRDY